MLEHKFVPAPASIWRHGDGSLCPLQALRFWKTMTGHPSTLLSLLSKLNSSSFLSTLAIFSGHALVGELIKALLMKLG